MIAPRKFGSALSIALALLLAVMPLAGHAEEKATLASAIAGIELDSSGKSASATNTDATFMRIVARKLDQRCRDLESYGWQFTSQDEKTPDEVFADTLKRLEKKGYTLDQPEKTREGAAPGMTILTAKHKDSRMILAWTAADTALGLLLCRAEISEAKTAETPAEQKPVEQASATEPETPPTPADEPAKSEEATESTEETKPADVVADVPAEAEKAEAATPSKDEIALTAPVSDEAPEQPAAEAPVPTETAAAEAREESPPAPARKPAAEKVSLKKAPAVEPTPPAASARLHTAEAEVPKAVPVKPVSKVVLPPPAEMAGMGADDILAALNDIPLVTKPEPAPEEPKKKTVPMKGAASPKSAAPKSIIGDASKVPGSGVLPINEARKLMRGSTEPQSSVSLVSVKQTSTEPVAPPKPAQKNTLPTPPEPKPQPKPVEQAKPVQEAPKAEPEKEEPKEAKAPEPAKIEAKNTTGSQLKPVSNVLKLPPGMESKAAVAEETPKTEAPAEQAAPATPPEPQTIPQPPVPAPAISTAPEKPAEAQAEPTPAKPEAVAATPPQVIWGERKLLPPPPVCPRGAVLQVEKAGNWHMATIKGGPDSLGRCRINYHGYSAAHDEWVSPERMRKAP